MLGPGRCLLPVPPLPEGPIFATTSGHGADRHNRCPILEVSAHAVPGSKPAVPARCRQHGEGEGTAPEIRGRGSQVPPKKRAFGGAGNCGTPVEQVL